MLKTYTKEEFLKKEYHSTYIFYDNYEEIPEHIKNITFKVYKLWSGSLVDYVTPFKNGGLDWLFEYIYKYQPKTAQVLKEAKNLFACYSLEKDYITERERGVGAEYLSFELKEKLLIIQRSFYENNLCDKLAQDVINGIEKVKGNSIDYLKCRKCSLPEKLMKAYYYNFNGLGFPLNTYIAYRVLPFDISTWFSLNDVFEMYNIKKVDTIKYKKYYDDFLYFITGERNQVNRFYNFMGTYYCGSKHKNDYSFFVHEYINTGDIYVINDKEIGKIYRLKNAVEVIDEYVAKVLTTYDSEFDFEPYLEEIEGAPKFDNEYYKGFEIEKISISGLKEEDKRKVLLNLGYTLNTINDYYFRIKTAKGYMTGDKKVRKSSNEFVQEYIGDLESKIEDIERLEIFEYENLEEYEFSMYSKYDIKKGKLEIVIPTMFKWDYDVEKVVKRFKEEFKGIRLIYKSVEDDSYKDFYREKIDKYFESIYRN